MQTDARQQEVDTPYHSDLSRFGTSPIQPAVGSSRERFPYPAR
jgi:hypothetical protein